VHFPAGFFSFSPDAQHPVGGASHRQPVGGSAAANSQIHNVPFAKGFLRVAVPHPARKETIYLCKGVSAWVAVAHPIRKNTFVLGKNMCACCSAPPGNRMKNTDCYFRRMGAGSMDPAGPAGGWGEAPQYFL